MSDLPPADWYPDPEDPTQQRYWDGTQWTEHRAPAAAPAEPAAPAAPHGSSPGGAPAPSWGQDSGGASWDQASGTPAWGQGATGAPGATGQSTNGMAITSLVIAVLSFFLAFVAIGGLGGIVAVVLGVLALRRVKETGQGGRGLAIGGIVVGALAVLLGIVMTIVFVFVGNVIESGSTGFTDFFECIEEEQRTGQDLNCEAEF